MGKREIIKKTSSKFFVERRRDGTFQKFTRIGKSLRADRRVKARTIVKKGFGHRGDLRKRKVF